MRIVFALLAFLAFIAGVVAWWMQSPREMPPPAAQNEPVTAVSVVAEGLDVPWDIAFLPEGGMLVTERPGRVVLVEEGTVSPVQEIEEVVQSGEGGLLGIALHPDFAENRYVYLYMTVSVGREPVNNVVRYAYRDGTLTFDRVILDGLPASQNHNGGRIAFGPDGMLYITTGDAGDSSSAQDGNSLAGKILRVDAEGSAAGSSLFGSTAVYSLGHRNPQGLAWDDAGRLWSTEHGRSGLQSGLDEINLITAGRNYGWPENEGDRAVVGTMAPARHSGATTTWAPASLAYANGRLFFGGLRGEALYEAVLDGERVTEVREHLKNEFGRIRAVTTGPDGMLYLTTSNRDGRGDVRVGDDKLLRVDPASL